MTSGEQSNGPIGPNSQQAFTQRLRMVCGFERRSIEESHRLVSEDNNLLLRELYSDTYDTRLIAMPNDSETIRTHGKLLENKLPVFDGMAADGLILLFIPEGAKPVTNILPAIARAPQTYGFLFKETGRLLRHLEDADFGAPATPGSPLFDHLAFAYDEESTEGGKLYLVPPYTFDKTLTTDGIVNLIAAELVSSGLFSAESADYLAKEVNEGWHESISA